MAEHLETPEKSYQEDDVLSQLTYKQLQQIAMSLRLPANLKQAALIAIIKAKQAENDDLVDRIVYENKRGRGRASRMTSTSPVTESLDLSPPMSPSEGVTLTKTSGVPLASSSPKIGTYVIQTSPVENSSSPDSTPIVQRPEQTLDVNTTTCMEISDLQCKEQITDAMENGSYHPHSSQSPDRLDMESPSTFCTDSVTNSIGSDLDPLMGVKDGLEYSEKDSMVKDFAELKPVPPADLMDLSLPVNLLDSSLGLRHTFGHDSSQDVLFHPIHTSLSQALIPYTSVEENMIINNPLVTLCTPDSTLDGHLNPCSSNCLVLGTENISVKPESEGITHVSFSSGESAVVRQLPSNLLKRPSQESDFGSCKIPKTKCVSGAQSATDMVLTVTSNPPVPQLLPQEEFIKIPKGLTVVPTSAPVTTSHTVTFTEPPLVTEEPTQSSSYSGKEKLVSRRNSSSFASVNLSDQSTSGVVIVPNNVAYFSAGTKLLASSNSRSKNTRSASKPITSGSWQTPSRGNIQTYESNLKSSFDTKKTNNKSGVNGKTNTNIKPNIPSKKPSLVKMPHQEVCFVYPEIGQIQFRPVMTMSSQLSPVKKPITTPIASAATSIAPQSRHHNIRPHPPPLPPSTPTSSVTTTFLPSANCIVTPKSARKAEIRGIPGLPNTVFSSSRNQTNSGLPAAVRPPRPDSVFNTVPNLHLPPVNLPPFNHLKDLSDGQKYIVNRSSESGHTLPAFSVDIGEQPPTSLHRRIDFAAQLHPAPAVLTKPHQIDVPPGQPLTSAFVGPNLPAVGQNFSHDNGFPTLRQMLDTPVNHGLVNREPGRRPPYTTFQFDNQGPNQLLRPQAIVPDHYKEMHAISQFGTPQIQNYPRMQFMPLRLETMEMCKQKTKEFLMEQRLAPTELPKSLESLLNFRGDIPSPFSETASKNGSACRSTVIDSLFVTSGIGPTNSVDCYDTPICSIKSEPTRSHVSTGSHHTGERHRAQQEFVPYSSNYSMEQGSEMYGLPPLNAALNPPCQPSWFQGDPCLPALPVNQYWPQAVNPQPALRLPQPFRPNNPRNVPNHYFAPLKSLHVPTHPNHNAFFNQPQLNNMGYQQGGILPPQDFQSYQPTETFDKVLPLQENLTPLVPQDQMTSQDHLLNQCQNQIHQDLPDFQGRNDQLSLSMIYSYLASTEHQMQSNCSRPLQPDNGDYQSQPNQRPVYSRPVFPGTSKGPHQPYGNASVVSSVQPPVTSASTSGTTARRRHSNGPSKNATRRQEATETTTLTREAANASVTAVRKKPNQERQKCMNFENGCSLILPLTQLAAHEECCEYINLKCPKETCEWNGRARKLATHIREIHRTEINSGTDSKHVLPTIESLKFVCFLQEVSRKLFAICVNCQNGVLYVSIQYIASGRSERPTSASGCIEVLGQDGHPHSWRGKLLPYKQSVETLLGTASCLEVNIATLGAFPKSALTLHVSIRVYSGNTNVTVQQGV